MKEAIFAGGCFWHIQKQFDSLSKVYPGIIETTVGYCGGKVKNPSYKQVCSGKTDHTESIKIIYKPNEITFEELCVFFMKIHDSTHELKTQYKSVIFFNSNYQKRIAERILSRYKNTKTQLIKFKNNFYNAEKYHQKYHQQYLL